MNEVTSVVTSLTPTDCGVEFVLSLTVSAEVVEEKGGCRLYVAGRPVYAGIGYDNRYFATATEAIDYAEANFTSICAD